MQRRYVRVTPAHEDLDRDEIVSQIAPLRDMRSETNDRLIGTSYERPTFEFLALSHGPNAPVEFLYGVDDEDYLNPLYQRLLTAYPESFDVEIIEGVDIIKRLVPRSRQTPEEFVTGLREGELQAADEYAAITDERSDDDDGDRDDGPGSTVASDGGVDRQSVTLADETATDTPGVVPDADDVIGPDRGDPDRLDPSDVANLDRLRELDPDALSLVELPRPIEEDPLNTMPQDPQWTADGDILARPTINESDEIYCTRWYGEGDRGGDWMTAIKMFSQQGDDESDEQQNAPLTPLVQHLADADVPIAFQVTFRFLKDWSRAAERWKSQLHQNRGTILRKVKQEIGTLFGSAESREQQRRERQRDYVDDLGESTDPRHDSPVSGRMGKRSKLIDNKLPSRNFQVNARAVSVVTESVDTQTVKDELNDLRSIWSHLDGPFYHIRGHLAEDMDTWKVPADLATKTFHRFINREMNARKGKKRLQLPLNADELANFIAVPSATALTTEGERGTRARPRTRNPLPRPNDDIMQYFHQPGMRVGYAADSTDEPEAQPTQIPPSRLPQHWARFGATGVGKSKAFINDMLSLYENTRGPIILIDHKGDGMVQEYLKAHYKRFGAEDLEQNVIEFPVPDILPGFTFFDIQPDLDHGARRTDAVQNLADKYDELMRLVNPPGQYEEAITAPPLIHTSIKALMDKHYYRLTQQRADSTNNDAVQILADRESANRFSHRHLEKLTQLIHDYGRSDGEEGELPEFGAGKESLQDIIQDQAKADPRQFSKTMNAVSNRLNYIREDDYLRQIFNNTTQTFDLHDHITDEHKVILFDLGDLRTDPSKILTGVILTELWDAMNHLDTADWDDDRMVNVVIDEAASIANSKNFNEMLERGRSFNLSLGLAMQWPQQIQYEVDTQAYRNVLNNVHSALFAKVRIDDDAPAAMASEELDIPEFNQRLKSLPPGEWLFIPPDPEFQVDAPEPFSLYPLDIPPGHPESDDPLDEQEQQRFEHHHQRLRERVRRNYGVSAGDEDTDDGRQATAAADQREQAPTGADESITMDTTTDTAAADPQAADDMEEDAFDIAEIEDTATTTTAADTTSDSTPASDDSSEATTADTPVEQYFKQPIDEGMPAHINVTENGYVCRNCGSVYGPTERQQARHCCVDALQAEGQERAALHNAIEAADMERETCVYDLGPYTYDDTATVEIALERPAFDDTVAVPLVPDDAVISHPTDITDLFAEDGVDPLYQTYPDYDAEQFGAILNAILVATPPEYHRGFERLIAWLVDTLRDTDEELAKREELIARPLGDTQLVAIESLVRAMDDAGIGAIELDMAALLETLGETPDPDVLADWRAIDAPHIKRNLTGFFHPDSHPTLARPGRYTRGPIPRTPPVEQPETAQQFDTLAGFALPQDDPHRPVDAAVAREKVRRGDVDRSIHTEYDAIEITDEVLSFLTAIVMGVNGSLPGYHLRESMTAIAEQFDVDPAALADAGLVQRRRGAHNRRYYNVPAEVQQYLPVTKDVGARAGDLGENTMHRVGVVLGEEYLAKQDTRTALKYVDDHGDRLDLLAYGETGDIDTVGEVEAGTIEADEYETQENRSGIRDTASIQKDYAQLSDREGTALWIVRDLKIARNVLLALDNDETNDVTISTTRLETIIENQKLEQLNTEIVDSFEGMDMIWTYRKLRSRLRALEDGDSALHQRQRLSE